MGENLFDLQRGGRLGGTQFGVKHRYPTLLASGTSFMEHNFSMDWGEWDGVGMIQAHYTQAHFCYAAQFLIGPGPVLVLDPEVGDP